MPVRGTPYPIRRTPAPPVICMLHVNMCLSDRRLFFPGLSMLLQVGCNVSRADTSVARVRHGAAGCRFFARRKGPPRPDPRPRGPRCPTRQNVCDHSLSGKSPLVPNVFVVLSDLQSAGRQPSSGAVPCALTAATGRYRRCADVHRAEARNRSVPGSTATCHQLWPPRLHQPGRLQQRGWSRSAAKRRRMRNGQRS